MLYNKMRPHTFDGMIGQETIVKSLQSQSLTGQFFNLYILEGQYGSGKTTIARILALASNCEQKDENGNPCLSCERCKAILSANSNDYMEVDAASNTGVEKARQLIEDVGYMPAFLKKKIYIIDEAHMLSKAAFNSLLKTLEDSPEYAMFILCTTEKDAIPLTIQSRAASYTFRKIPEEAISNHLLKTGRKEYPGILLEPEAISTISAHSDGSMRNALSLLEQAATYGDITQENVAKMLGVADTAELISFMSCLAKGDMPGSIQMADRLISGGRGLLPLTTDMLRILQDALVVAVSRDISMISGASKYRKSIQDIAGLTDSGRLCCMIEEVMNLRSELRKNQVETLFTCSLVKICATERSHNTKTLEKRLEDLEEKMNASQISECKKSNEHPDIIPTVHAEVSLGMTECELTETQAFTNEELLLMFDMAEPFPGPMASPGKCQCIENGTEQENTETMPNSSKTAENKEDQASEAAMETIARINEMKESEPAFCSAIEEGSKCFVFGSTVEYRSPLKPVCNLLKKYFEVFGIQAKACFDPSIKV